MELINYTFEEMEYGTYGVFELPEGAVLRHHSEEYIRQLTNSFGQKHFERLLFTTMNGHTSNGFLYREKQKFIFLRLME